MKLLVRGGGVAGLACAVTLAEHGAHVTLTEAATTIGAGASWKAGGMLAPWCEAETAPPGLLEASLPSLAWWRRQIPQTAFNGTLVLTLSRDAAELDRMSRRTTGHRRVDDAEIALLEPALEGRFRRGLFYAGEAHLDPRLALPALADRLGALGGVVLTGQAGIPPGDFDRIVDASGIGARDDLPALRGVRGEMMLLRAPGVTLSRPLRLLHPRFPVYLVPRADDVFMVGATMIESEQRGPPCLRSMMELMSAAFAVHPGFAEAEILEIAADLRPSFGDNMPRIVEKDGCLHVNGMYRHGFLMAPALAAQLIEIGLRPNPPKGSRPLETRSLDSQGEP